MVEEAAGDELVEAAVEEVVAEVETEPEEVIEDDLAGRMSPAETEELAALVSSQLEEVMTRLVEEKLPAIVEHFFRKEIEKIRTALKPEE